MNDRQEAERFAALLEAHAAGRGESAAGHRSGDGVHAAGHGSSAAYPAGGAGYDGSAGGLVALAERVTLAAPSVPGPGMDFREALRARLVAEAPTLVAEGAAGAKRPRSRVPAQRAGRGARTGARHSAGESKAGVLTGISASWRRRLLAAGVGVAVATGSVGGIAIASAGAVPGDPLYNAKKIFESLQLSLSGSPTDQGRDYLHLADVRLGEIDSLLGRPDVDQPGSGTQKLLAQTLTDLRTMISTGGGLLVAQVSEHGDQTALHALSDFLLTERQRVEDLSWRLPPDLQAQPPQLVALMDQLSKELQVAAQKAAADQHQQGPGVGDGPGVGAQPGGNGGGETGVTNPSASSTAASATATSATGEASSTSGSTAGSSSGASASSSPSAGSTIGVSLGGGGILPSIGVTVPGLLGLPEIDLNLGGDGSSATPTN